MRTNSIRRNKRGLASLSVGGGTPKGVPEGVSLNRSRALKFQRKAFSLGRRWPESIDSGRMWGLTSIRAVGEERTGSPPHPSRLAPCRPLHQERAFFALPAGRKASPGGEAGATSVATDEVEATDYRHRLVRRCYLRPHPVRRCRTTIVEV